MLNFTLLMLSLPINLNVEKNKKLEINFKEAKK